MIDFSAHCSEPVRERVSAYDAEITWHLDHSLALVVPPPGSIYNANRPDFGPRWDGLVEGMAETLRDRIASDARLKGMAVSQDPYRTPSPEGVGGAFGDLTVVFTIAENVNDFVQDASGWLAIADLIRGFYADRQRVSFERHEHDEADRVTFPLPSLKGIEALCIADMLTRFQLETVPSYSIESRNLDLRHPNGEGRYIFAATNGEMLPQTVVYVVAASGICLENFALVNGKVTPLLIPLWLPWHSISAI